MIQRREFTKLMGVTAAGFLASRMPLHAQARTLRLQLTVASIHIHVPPVRPPPVLP